MPIAVLAGHGAVHVLFVLLAGVAADWAMQQQVLRIQVDCISAANHCRTLCSLFAAAHLGQLHASPQLVLVCIMFTSRAGFLVHLLTFDTLGRLVSIGLFSVPTTAS